MFNIVPRFSPTRIKSTTNDAFEPLLKTKIEWEEKHESHVYRVNLLGFKKHEVRVSVNVVEGGERQLHIMVERWTETLERHKADHIENWHNVERRTRGLRKSFRLPDDITTTENTVVMTRFNEESGVFTITIPKGVSKNNNVLIN